MAGAEELYESDVLWPERPRDDGDDAAPAGCRSTPAPPRGTTTPARRGGSGDGERRRPCSATSWPVDIPRPARSARRCDDDDDDDGRAGTMVPPHVLVSRRQQPEAAFALRSGPGRARELSHLRNNVLRMTGFIEG